MKATFSSYSQRLGKIILLIPILTCGCFIFSSAQQEGIVDQRIRAGAVIGLSASQVDGDDYAGFHKVGITAGFVGQIPVSKKFFFTTEILYVQKGAKSPTYMGQPLAYLLRLDYAEIPVLIHFQEKKAFNFGIGMSFGRLVRQDEEVYQIQQPKAIICTGKIDREVVENTTNFFCLRKNEFAAMGDMSYLISKHFGLNVRFSYSVAPIGYRSQSNFVNRGMYNSNLYFRAIYMF